MQLCLSSDVLAELDDALRRQNVNLVELDLLIGGERLPYGRPLPPGHYYASIIRAQRRDVAEIYAWTVRDCLPRIPIPLSSSDPDVWTDLGQVFTEVYDQARYGRSIDYSKPAELGWDAASSEWAASRGALE